MKLRTVIYELPCSDYVAHPEALLERDVAASPSKDAPVGSESVLRLCSEREFEERELAPADGEILLVWCGSSISDRMRACGPDIVLVSSDTDYARFQQLFSSIPEKYLHMSVERERLFAAFMGSYDIQQFVDKAEEIIGDPIIVINSDRKLIASAGEFPKDRPDVLEEINQGYLSEEVNSQMEADGIIEGVRHAHHSVLSDNAKYGQRWVTSIIYYRHIEMGRFDVLENEHVIEGTDLELIDFAGSLAGILIDRMGIGGDEAGSGSSVLSDILTKNFANEKTMKAQLALTHVPLESDYVLMSVVAEGMGPEYLARIGRALQQHVRHSIWCTVSDMLVLLIPIGTGDGAGYDDYDRAIHTLRGSRGLFGYLSNNGLSAYVCEPFDRLGLAAGRLEQCKALADVRPRTKGPVWYFWEWRYEALAGSAKTFTHVDMMVDKRVLQMARYDDEHGTSYLETAIMSVRYPGSPAEAAEELHVHRNTYFYRMNKVRELFFLDLKDGDDRLAVAFTSRVMGYLGNNLYSALPKQE